MHGMILDGAKGVPNRAEPAASRWSRRCGGRSVNRPLTPTVAQLLSD